MVNSNSDESIGQAVPVIGFGRRLVANLIDMVVVGVLTFLAVIGLSTL